MAKLNNGGHYRSFRANRRVQGRFAWGAEEHARHNAGQGVKTSARFKAKSNKGGID